MSTAATNTRVPAATSCDGGLPDDIILIILLKLPVKSLIRFCSLSKQWNSTIRSSKFAKQHINHHMTSTISTVIHSRTPPDTQTLRLLLATPISSTTTRSASSADDDAAADIGKTFKLIEDDYDDKFRANTNIRTYPRSSRRNYILRHMSSSCNGLLFTAIIVYRCTDRVVIERTMRVCNPATRQSKDLADLPVEFIGDQPQKFNGHFILGFGYDPSTDDAKVVYSFEVDQVTTRRRVTLVLSMRTNTWRQVVNTSATNSPDQLISKCLPLQLTTIDTATVAFSGNVYWIVYCTTTSKPREVMILQYSFADDRFELLPFEEKKKNDVVNDDDDDDSIRHAYTRACCLALSNHKGSLYMFVTHSKYSKPAACKIDIWSLEIRTAAAAAANTNSTSTIVCQKVGVINNLTIEGTMLYPIGFNCSGHIIMRRFLNFSTRYIYAYLLKENKCVELCQIESKCYVHLVPMETLTSPRRL